MDLEGQRPLGGHLRTVKVLSVAENRDDLVPVGDFVDVQGLQITTPPNPLGCPELQVCNVQSVGLIYNPCRDPVGPSMLQFDGLAKIGRGLFDHVREDRIGRSEVEEFYILEVLRPDHRRAQNTSGTSYGCACNKLFQSCPASNINRFIVTAQHVELRNLVD